MKILGVPPETWFPVISLVVGVGLKAIFDALSDKRIVRRERDARKEQRLDVLLLKRTESQRATLLELQDAVSRLGRFSGLSHHEDTMAYHATGVWGAQQISEEANQGLFEAFTNMSKLRVRVADEKTRELAAVFSEECSSLAFVKTKDDADEIMRRATSLMVELHERIGFLLRNLVVDEDGFIRDL